MLFYFDFNQDFVRLVGRVTKETEHTPVRLKFHDTVRRATMYPREHQLRRYLRGWNSIREQGMVHGGHLDDAAPSARWYTKRRVEISNVYIEPMEQTSHEEGEEPMEERELASEEWRWFSGVTHAAALGGRASSCFGFRLSEKRTQDLPSLFLFLFLYFELLLFITCLVNIVFIRYNKLAVYERLDDRGL